MEKEAVVKLVINNIDEFYELIKKAQAQSAELSKTISKIQEFIPEVELSNSYTNDDCQKSVKPIKNPY